LRDNSTITMTTTPSLTTPADLSDAHGLSQSLQGHIAEVIARSGGWIGFDRYMELALYTPRLGYYAHGSAKFGAMPQGLRDGSGTLRGAGSDFVTAPEMTPLFGYALARQVAQALQQTGTTTLWEFGAGSGALALQLLKALAAMGQEVTRYCIVDLSDSLRTRQHDTLKDHLDTVCWVGALPQQMEGVVIGNEVLDAMPVRLLSRVKGEWFERGVELADVAEVAVAASGQFDLPASRFRWADRTTALRFPREIPGTHDYLSELHQQGEAFIRTLAGHLSKGAIFMIDYGFPEAEYYHPQRHMGTVMCHHAHQADPDPLSNAGLKDITAHVNFTSIAVAAQDAGLELLGYTCQAHFLINCGLIDLMQESTLAHRAAGQKLIMEHEMGELFKVIGWVKGPIFDALGFSNGDRSHRL